MDAKCCNCEAPLWLRALVVIAILIEELRQHLASVYIQMGAEIASYEDDILHPGKSK